MHPMKAEKLGKYASRLLHAVGDFTQVVQGVTKGHFQLRQLFEIVTHDVLIRHANATVQLNRLLAHKAHGVAQLVFGASHGLMSLCGGGVQLQAGVVAH